MELARLHIEDHRPHHVRGHEIGRELDAAELGIDQRRQRLRHQGFCRAGDAFEQHVTPREQRHQHQFDSIFLPDDGQRRRFAQLIGNRFQQGAWL